MNKYYLRIEGVNIYDFVADTKDLSTIRGGGLILLDSITDVQARFGLSPISTGASSGLFEFQATLEDAAKLLRNIQTFLNDDPKYKHATFVVDIVQAGSENFVRDKETLIARNRWQQMQSPSIAIAMHNNEQFIYPCAENKVRPAREAGKDKTSVSVSERQNYGREKKQLFYEDQIGRPITSNPNRPRKFTRDFGDLATFSDDEKRNLNANLDGKMAVIYIDGNKFGTIQADHCKTAKAQRDFDGTLQGLRRRLLDDLVDYMEGNDFWLAPENSYRIETLLWGGDEIVWAVPAWQGWRTIEFFYQQAHKKNWEFEGVPLTHSAGVVFCNHKAPIHRVRKLAEELANSVKDKVEPNGNFFAYEILESFDHIGREVEQYRLERIPAALRSTEGTKALILDGDRIFETGENSVIKIVSKLTEKLPRRRLSNVAKELLKEGRQEEAEKQVIQLLEEMRDSREDLKTLYKKFDGSSSGNEQADYISHPMMWIHLNSLWDYLAIE